MRSTGRLILIVSVLQFTVAVADESVLPSSVDISEWNCKFCEFAEGWSGDVELGLWSVSDDSFKFGQYTGLNEEGVSLLGNADLYYRNANAGYLNVSISELGLDSRSLSIDGGIQGKYKLFLHYDEIPNFISDSAATPFVGNGGEFLILPSGWVEAGSTAGMSALTGSLAELNIETQRQHTDLGLIFTPTSPWKYTVNFSQKTKEGIKPIAGSFYFRAAQLAEPVDYVTRDMDVSVAYDAKKWQARVTYFLSAFSNSNKSLTWQNPYNPIVPGADTGQLSLPPDNEFHQLLLSANYKLGARSLISGDIATGSMKQDETFLPLTQNSMLASPALPVDSANAKVDTLNAKLKYVSTLTDKLRIDASYTYNDRDNKTPQLVYDWVTTDAFVASPRSNLPYSFTSSAFRLNADYKATKGIKIGVGYDVNAVERTLQEVDKTQEDTIWGKIRVSRIDNLSLELKLAQSKRDASVYGVVEEIDPPENILLRKYNMANRVRETAGLHANYTPHPRYAIGLHIDVAEDDYEQSIMGLTEASEQSLNVDITAMLTETISISLFMGRQEIESIQTGGQFSTALWTATNDDAFDYAGIGYTHIVIEDKLDIGADYTETNSTGKITVTSGMPDPAFPILTTALDSFKIYANYRFSESLKLKVAYWRERYGSTDWALDGIRSDTISGVLGFGEVSPRYDVDVIRVSLRYQF